MSARRWLSRATSAAIAALAVLHTSAAWSESAGEAAPQPSLVEITINGQQLAEPAILLRSSDGGFFAPEDAVRAWHLATLAAAPRLTYDNRQWLRLDAAGIRLKFSESRQSLTIDADPSAFDRQVLQPQPDSMIGMSAPSPGAYFNYDTFLEYSGGRPSVAGSFDLVGFSSAGVGEANFIGHFGQGDSHLTRLETNWTIDRPGQMVSIRIGDSVSRAAFAMTPVRFAGLQFGRNFDTQPGFITFPLPSINGSAAVPSVAEVYVDSVLRESRDVNPGPFTIDQAPVRSGGGTVQLVTRDLLGRQIVTTQPYYTSTVLLRKGLSDFSYEAGFLRNNFGTKSADYGQFMLSGLHRYGLTDRLTVEGGLRATPHIQTTSAAVTAVAFDLAQLTASAAVSHSRDGTGSAVGIGLERQAHGLSFGGRVEFRDSGYREAGEPESLRTKLAIQAFADVETDWGSIGLNYFRREDRSGPGESLAGINANIPIAARASLQLYARRVLSGEKATMIGSFLAVAFGARRSASANAEYNDGRFVTRYSTQQDLPAATGSGFRASAELGEVKSFDAQYMVNSNFGRYSAEYSQQGSSRGIRLSAAGSLGLLGGSAFAARQLGSSFAEVQVGTQVGVRVYADNQLIGKTGQDGRLMLPILRSYEVNKIRIDDADLPLNAKVDSFETKIRPYGRTGTVVRFNVDVERGAILHLVRADGSPLPEGVEVTLAGKPEQYTVISGGEVYIPSLGNREEVIASWPNGRCSVDVQLPANNDPQPVIDHLVCRPERYAAR
ncbi:MAG TPA: fimbria/pilus outer membrane usher protein [Sphingomicrobium sp.]|nr:fimbria/pilus outer membrane usher protein [Sphingomicrobium sp.]